MNAQDLKNSILQLAIQGKLVEQRKEEGNAKELLEQIKVEREQLIKEKKIKKEKSLPEITKDEIPFDVPESWEWVRLGQVTDYGIRKQVNKTGIPSNSWILELEDIDKATYRIIEKRYDRTPGSSKNSFSAGDVLYGKLRPYLKKCVVVNEGGYCSTEIIPFKGYCEINSKYLMYCMTSPLIDYTINSLTYGMDMPRLGTKDAVQLLIPLPPLDEQKRIVVKIEELMPYVEKYGESHSKLEALNKKFPEDMQKSILQYAIQGKLVEQRDEEGTAETLYQQIQEEKAKLIKEGKLKKGKPLPTITEDEPPFDIPDSWKWVRLGDICEKIGSGSTPTGGKSVYKESGIKFLRSQNIYNDGLRMDNVAYISDEQNKKGSTVKAKDILLNITGGSIGRCALVPDDFDVANINQHVMIIRNLVSDNRYFMHYILISPYIQSLIMSVQVGVSREGLSAEKLNNFLIPLPPLEEQKRIVAKFEEITPFFQQLVK